MDDRDRNLYKFEEGEEVPVLMKLYMYLAIAVALLAVGILYFVEWKRYRRRPGDLGLAVLFILSSVSFGLYGFENLWEPSVLSQMVVDTCIFLTSAHVFLSSVLKELKRHRGEKE